MLLSYHKNPSCHGTYSSSFTYTKAMKTASKNTYKTYNDIILFLQLHTFEKPPLEENPNFNAFRWSWSTSAVALFFEVETLADPDSSCCCSCCSCLRVSALYCIKQYKNKCGKEKIYKDNNAQGKAWSKQMHLRRKIRMLTSVQT